MSRRDRLDVPNTESEWFYGELENDKIVTQ